MRGFRLDTEHDLALDLGGRLVPIEGDEATLQEIKTRLWFFRGQSFTDAREGVPYFQEILKKGVIPARVRQIIRQVVASHPAIVDVPRIELSIDRQSRQAVVSWEARTLSGSVLKSTDFAPLFVT